MIRQRQGIPITEVWSRNSWRYFDTYNAITTATTLGREPNPDTGLDLPFSLATQRHIDLRTFTEGPWTYDNPAPLPELGRVGIPAAGITPGYLADFNNVAGATLVVASGENNFTSEYLEPIDLAALGSDTQLVLTIPDLDMGVVIPETSSLILSSDNFIHTLVLGWSESLTDPVSDKYLSWPYSALTGIDLTRVTNVRLVINATTDALFHALALRLIDNAWVPTSMEFNNLEGRLQKSIPLDANNDPYPNNRTMPVLWRAAEVSGIDDPRPINAELSFIFNVGSQTGINTFRAYMRETTKAFMTQAALDGDTQAMLTGKPQPTDADFEVLPRPMSDLDQFTMDQLTGESMHNLEAVANEDFSSWIRFSVTWGPNTYVRVTNSINPIGGFQYTGLRFTNHTSYVAICNLTDGKARMQVYSIDQDTFKLEDLLFDTTEIPDEFFFPRRPGRLGFQGVFTDGDAWVGPVRPRGLMFAEYRSQPLRSITPVRGARLYAQNTAPKELFSTWYPLTDTMTQPTLTNDQQRFVPDAADSTSTKVTIITPSDPGSLPAQGLVSNVLSPDAESGITDFDQLHIRFSIWVPGSTMVDPLKQTTVTPIAGATVLRAGLFNAQLTRGVLHYPGSDLYPRASVYPGYDFHMMGLTEFRLPQIIPDQWQTINVFRPMAKPYPQSGPYRLVIFYYGSIPTTFWIDEVSVHQHAVRWDARSVVDDPWHSQHAPWTIFHENVNSDVKQIGFTTMGSELQIRGQALAQNTAIVGPPKVVPQYAELGRFAWPEDKYVSAGSPFASIGVERTGRQYTFTATATSPNGIANYEWSFGDGTFDTGPVVQHQYPSYLASGTTFTVYLTVWDRAGLNYSVGNTFSLV